MECWTMRMIVFVLCELFESWFISKLVTISIHYQQIQQTHQTSDIHTLFVYSVELRDFHFIIIIIDSMMVFHVVNVSKQNCVLTSTTGYCKDGKFIIRSLSISPFHSLNIHCVSSLSSSVLFFSFFVYHWVLGCHTFPNRTEEIWLNFIAIE